MRILRELFEQYLVLLENDVYRRVQHFQPLILEHLVKMIMSRHHDWFVANTHKKWFREISQNFVNKIISEMTSSSKKISRTRFTAEHLKWRLFGDPYHDDQVDHTSGTSWEVKLAMKSIVTDHNYKSLGLTSKDLSDAKVTEVKKLLDEFYPALCDVMISKVKSGQQMTSSEMEQLCRTYSLTK